MHCSRLRLRFETLICSGFFQSAHQDTRSRELRCLVDFTALGAATCTSLRVRALILSDDCQEARTCKHRCLTDFEPSLDGSSALKALRDQVSGPYHLRFRSICSFERSNIPIQTHDRILQHGRDTGIVQMHAGLSLTVNNTISNYHTILTVL